MNKAEALEIIDDYETDFEAIESVIDDDSLTPSEKVSQIEDLISEDDEPEN